MAIGIFVGSIRKGRLAEHIKNWLVEQARDRDVEYRVLDLAEFNVPLIDAELPAGAAQGVYDHPDVTAWSEAVKDLDGYVFVTPEYNHSVPGPMKNAFDALAVEWIGKPVAFVGYGATGGIRAVEAWRLVVANLSMPQVRNQLDLNLFSEFGDNGFQPNERRAAEIDAIFTELETMAAKAAEASGASGAAKAD